MNTHIYSIFISHLLRYLLTIKSIDSHLDPFYRTVVLLCGISVRLSVRTYFSGVHFFTQTMWPAITYKVSLCRLKFTLKLVKIMPLMYIVCMGSTLNLVLLYLCYRVIKTFFIQTPKIVI